MSLPEGWEWMDDLPPGWSPPPEIRTPTGIPRIDLPIRMLSSGALGNDLVELVGQFLSESSRFSIWIGSEVKRRASAEELAILSQTTSGQLEKVYFAWVDFITAYEASRRMSGRFTAEESALRQALADAIENIKTTRVRGSHGN